MQQQEKLKQKMFEEQQQQQQQHSIVPLTPESVARFLANQNQNQTPTMTTVNQPWTIHQSISAPTLPTYTNNHIYEHCHSVNYFFEFKYAKEECNLRFLVK